MTIADYGFAIWETFYVTVLSTAFSPVSYTHLTLPTKRIV